MIALFNTHPISSLPFIFPFVAGLGWSYPCDMWSVGCILVELCTVSPYIPIY